MNTKISSICILLLASALSACGGGGGGGTNTDTPPPTGGIGRTGFAAGTISTFGSIVVNGVRYETSSATFTINDGAGVEDDLRVGDFVVLKGTIDANGTTGTADEVTFEDAVTGPVDSINLVGSSLVVMGQNVRVSPDTSFDDSFLPASLDGVTVGQIVEVSGQFDANGDIAATRIEPKPAGTQFEVHGIVAMHDAMNQEFTLGSLVIDYSMATLDDFPGGQINDDDLVEAKGTTLGGAGELLAMSVELETPFPDVEEDDFAEIEGFITRFVDSTDFDVAGFPVTTNAQTVYEGGTEADLGPNIKVEVEGTIDASGIVVAEEVDIRRAKAVRATALIDSVDAANSSVVLLGITVKTDNLTRFEDKTSADVDPLTIDDINAGEYVEVRGDEFPAGSGEILATIFEREDVDPDTELQGFVATIADPNFTILGVTIETNGTTVFRDENDVAISRNDFFNRLAANDLVKATGSEVTDTTIVATEVEFELEL
jgi:hypothetical protein